MLARTFGPLVNRYLRYERRDNRSEDAAKSVIAQMIAGEVMEKPIVFNGVMWHCDPAGRLKRVRVRVLK